MNINELRNYLGDDYQDKMDWALGCEWKSVQFRSMPKIIKERTGISVSANMLIVDCLKLINQLYEKQRK